jgi:hypothetical protein
MNGYCNFITVAHWPTMPPMVSSVRPTLAGECSAEEYSEDAGRVTVPGRAGAGGQAGMRLAAALSGASRHAAAAGPRPARSCGQCGAGRGRRRWLRAAPRPRLRHGPGRRCHRASHRRLPGRRLRRGRPRRAPARSRSLTPGTCGITWPSAPQGRRPAPGLPQADRRGRRGPATPVRAHAHGRRHRRHPS